jgi:hypothetical protein
MLYHNAPKGGMEFWCTNPMLLVRILAFEAILYCSCRTVSFSCDNLGRTLPPCRRLDVDQDSATIIDLVLTYKGLIPFLFLISGSVDIGAKLIAKFL